MVKLPPKKLRWLAGKSTMNEAGGISYWKHGDWCSIVMWVFGGQWYFFEDDDSFKGKFGGLGPGALDSIRCFMFTAEFHGVLSLKLTTSCPLKLCRNTKKKSDCLPFPSIFQGPFGVGFLWSVVETLYQRNYYDFSCHHLFKRWTNHFWLISSWLEWFR